MPTLFTRDPTNRGRVTSEVTDGCGWVLVGQGTATRKFDGTCVMFDGTDRFARREVKPGKKPPPDWSRVDHDPTTGKSVGWEPIGQSPFVKTFRQVRTLPNECGTYELCGPSVNGNPEGFDEPTLVPHGRFELPDAPRTYTGLVRYLSETIYEGIVWHHPDGRRAKLKRRDVY